MNTVNVKSCWSKEYQKENNLGHLTTTRASLLKNSDTDPCPVLLIETVTEVPKGSELLATYQRCPGGSIQSLNGGENFIFERSFSIKVSTFQEIFKDIEEIMLIMKLY